MFKFLQKLLFKTVQRFRIWQYRLLSNAVLDGVKPHLRQPLQAIGSGVIEFEKGVSIGFFPSPFFFSSYAYLDVRNKTSKIVIGENTSINNGFVMYFCNTHIRNFSLLGLLLPQYLFILISSIIFIQYFTKLS